MEHAHVAPSGRPEHPGVSRRRLLTAAAGTAAVAASGVLLPATAEAASPPLYTRCSFGAHADNEPYPDVYPHFGLESITTARLPRMSWFQDMGAPWPTNQAADAARTHHALCIAWTPSAYGTQVSFDRILSGEFDSLLRKFFSNAAKHPRSVTIRPFWEMNCSASSASVDYRNGPRLVTSVNQFKDTWRHLVGLQRQVGATNVKWFFCVNGSDVGTHRMEEYWPGAEYVDEVGLDTYNDDWSPWADFDVKVAPMYTRLAALDPYLPISIGEIGCKDYGAPPGQSKASWSEKMFLSSQFPRLRHVDFYNRNQGIDWRLQSSGSSLAVYRKYLPQATSGLITW